MRLVVHVLLASAFSCVALVPSALALTSEQCTYFAVNGRVRICHATGSPHEPYAPLDVNERACVAHADHHAADYVAVDDASCQGVGCLPAGSPCDATAPCCDGLTCVDGRCVDASGTTVAAVPAEAARAPASDARPPVTGAR